MKTDLACFGNLIVDDVVFADGTTRMGQPGGAMLYTALGAALWGVRVAIVAPVGDDYPRETLRALESRGVDLSGLRPLGRAGLRTWLLYEPIARRVLHRLGSPTHAEASPQPEDIRGPAAEARAFHLAPIPVECQARLLGPLSTRADALLSLDPHDPLREGTFDRWRPLLPLLDLLFVSEEEIWLPGLERDPATLGGLAGGRLRAIAHKRGAQGGVYFDLARPRRARRRPDRSGRRIRGRVPVRTARGTGARRFARARGRVRELRARGLGLRRAVRRHTRRGAEPLRGVAAGFRRVEWPPCAPCSRSPTPSRGRSPSAGPSWHSRPRSSPMACRTRRASRRR